MAHMLAMSGCAPWAHETTTNYVTVANETGNDTGKARKLYGTARKEMTKHVRGGKCDFAKAEERLQHALAADVRFGPAHHSLGVLYFWQNKLYLAAWEFEYAARLMPDRFEPLNNLGLVYESVGKLDQAKMYYCLAREKAQCSAEVIGNLARVSLRSGQSANAIRPLLEDVLATDPRPEWRRWAGETLGLASAHSCPSPPGPGPTPPRDEPFPLPAGEEPTVLEDLPLLAPPLPETRPVAATPSGSAPPCEPAPALGIKLGVAHDASPTL
jgi:hypothetical protein